MIPDENGLSIPLNMLKPTLHHMSAVGEMRVSRL